MGGREYYMKKMDEHIARINEIAAEYDKMAARTATLIKCLSGPDPLGCTARQEARINYSEETV